MRLALDYTAAVRQSAGIGRYTRGLVSALIPQLHSSDQLLLWYAARDVAAGEADDDRIRQRRVPIDERWLTAAWQRLRLPIPVEALLGRFDLLHCPDFVAPPSLAPSVVTIHDLSYLITPQYAHPDLVRYLSAAVPRTLDRVERVIAVSESTRQDLLERYGLAPEQVVTIYNGLDERRPPSQTRPEVGAGRSDACFLIVGTIEPRKNHLTLLQAFERLHETHRESSLLIVGRPGWLAEPILREIESAARHLPVRHLTGASDDDLARLFAEAVALVYPSWYEGFGLPVLEAMAAGTPVITSDRGALPEIAGNAALLADPGDPEAIAEQMRLILEDRDLRRSLAQRGLARARAFSWQQSAARHLEVYRELSDR